MRAPMVEGSPTDGGLAGYLRKGIRNAPREDGAAREMLRSEIALGGQAVPGRTRRRYRTPRPRNVPKRPVAKKRPTFWVVRPKISSSPPCAWPPPSWMGRSSRRYRPVEERLPDEEGEEPGQETGKQPGGQAAAQVGRDHALAPSGRERRAGAARRGRTRAGSRRCPAACPRSGTSSSPLAESRTNSSEEQQHQGEQAPQRQGRMDDSVRRSSP